jgi:hypothetical protein
MAVPLGVTRILRLRDEVWRVDEETIVPGFTAGTPAAPTTCCSDELACAVPLHA